jgi:hypothetical protein
MSHVSIQRIHLYFMFAFIETCALHKLFSLEIPPPILAKLVVEFSSQITLVNIFDMFCSDFGISEWPPLLDDPSLSIRRKFKWSTEVEKDFKSAVNELVRRLCIEYNCP